jgi:hypothetical protein
VIAKQKEIDQVKLDMADMIAEWKDKIKEKEQKLANRPDLASSSLDSEIKMVDGEIKRDKACLRTMRKRLPPSIINNYGAELSLGVIERDYQTKKAAYDQLLGQQQKITLSADAFSTTRREHRWSTLLTCLSLLRQSALYSPVSV